MDKEQARKGLLKVSLQFAVGSIALIGITLLFHPLEDVSIAEDSLWLAWLAAAYALAAIPASVLVRDRSMRKAAQTVDANAGAPTGRAATSMFLGLAVAESGSLVGFVSFMRMGELLPAIIAIVLGTIAITMHIPTVSRWDAWLATLTKSAQPSVIS